MHDNVFAVSTPRQDDGQEHRSSRENYIQIFLLIFPKKQLLQPYLFKSVPYFGDLLDKCVTFDEIISFLV